jgi:hypothetical protein
VQWKIVKLKNAKIGQCCRMPGTGEVITDSQPDSAAVMRTTAAAEFAEAVAAVVAFGAGVG